MLTVEQAVTFPQRISESVYLLGNPYFQTYLVRGDSCALVEGGVSWTVTLIVEQLQQLGILGSDLKYLIIPHAHFDHVCGIPGLKQAFPHLQVLASDTASKVLGKEKVVTGFYEEDRVLTQNLQKKSQPDHSGNSGQSPILPPASIDVDRVIAEGDRLDLGLGNILEFIRLPGHSPCGMGLYLPSEQVLFPSDSGGYQINEDTIFPMYFAGYEDYLHSLKRLSEVEASVLAAPHELLITGRPEMGRFFKRSIESTMEMYNSILRDYRGGNSREEISRKLFQRYYRGGMVNMSEGNIRLCTDLLVRRTLETIGE